MSDLISRAAAIAEIEDYIEEYSEVDEKGWHNLKWCAMEEAKDVLERAHAVDAVPIKPLSVWLAGYCAPPAYSLDGVPFKTEAAVKRRAEAWEQHIRNLIECGLMEDE